MTRPPKVLSALLAAVLVVGLAACGSSGHPAGGSSAADPSRSGGGAGGEFRGQNLLVSAACTAGPSGGGLVEVDGWDPQTWQQVAHAEFRLPETVVTRKSDKLPYTPVADLCSVAEPHERSFDALEPGEVAMVRSLFDQDYRKIAVVIQDRQSGATHVGYVDRSGKLTDLTASDASFGVTPKEEKAVMSRDGETVWFTYLDENRDFHVASRGLQGDHKKTERAEGGFNEYQPITLGSGGWVVMSLNGAYLAPDGRHIQVDGHLVDASGQPGLVTAKTVEAAPAIRCADVAGWIDNDTVLCGEGDFSTVDIAPKAARSASILPKNDQETCAMVVSPDGQKVIFRSAQQDVAAYYVVDTKPASTPVQVTGPGRMATLGGTMAFVEWR